MQRPILSAEDLHFIGKLLDHADDEMLLDLGFAKSERVRAGWVFEDLDGYLTATLGDEWNDERVT
jgi:hypothetical protein